MLMGCGASYLVGLCGCHKGCRAKIFRDMGKGSLVLVEMGLWECFFVCIGNLSSIISHCCIYGND